MNIANKLFPVMSELVPPECLNTICETQRQAKGEDSIGSLAKSMLNSTKETTLLIKDASKKFIDASNNLVNDIGDFTKSAFNNVKNLVTTFNVYNLCPRRFNDWLEDAKDSFGLPPSIDAFLQLQNTFNDTLMAQFGKILNNCVTKTLTKNAINELTEIRLCTKTTINRFCECTEILI